MWFLIFGVISVFVEIWSNYIIWKLWLYWRFTRRLIYDLWYKYCITSKGFFLKRKNELNNLNHESNIQLQLTIPISVLKCSSVKNLKKIETKTVSFHIKAINMIFGNSTWLFKTDMNISWRTCREFESGYFCQRMR